MFENKLGTVARLSKQESDIRASKISKRLQVVGSQALRRPGLTGVEEGVFSNHGAQGSQLGDRLIIARETNKPLVEIMPVYRGGVFAEGIFTVLGVKQGDPLILQVGCSIERDDYYDRNSYEYAAVSLEIPGEHTISIDGVYGRLVTSCYEHTTYNAPVEGAEGLAGSGGYGSSYGYEGVSGFLSGSHKMEALLSMLDAENRMLKIGRRGIFDWLR